MREREYEFRTFGEDAAGPERVEHHTYGSESSARAKAGRLAIQTKGPVDLAVSGSADWDERYITTASPSEFHEAGYRCERLDN